MVLNFSNNVIITGGSLNLRLQCMEELQERGICSASYSHDSVECTGAMIDTAYAPLDNALLDLAPKYLALDFTVQFEPKSDALLKDWKGCIRVIDQKMYFSDNYEAADGYDLGCIYALKAQGGFPGCLINFQG